MSNLSNTLPVLRIGVLKWNVLCVVNSGIGKNGVLPRSVDRRTHSGHSNLDVRFQNHWSCEIRCRELFCETDNTSHCMPTCFFCLLSPCTHPYFSYFCGWFTFYPQPHCAKTRPHTVLLQATVTGKTFPIHPICMVAKVSISTIPPYHIASSL